MPSVFIKDKEENMNPDAKNSQLSAKLTTDYINEEITSIERIEKQTVKESSGWRINFKI
jgi:hypothetical protein